MLTYCKLLGARFRAILVIVALTLFQPTNSIAFSIAIHRDLVDDGASFVTLALADGRLVQFGYIALYNIEQANIAVDSNQGEGDAFLHFDNEKIESGARNVIDVQNEVVRLLKQNPRLNALKARKLLGEGLHSLQDFYAHSTWVETQVLANVPRLQIASFDSPSITASSAALVCTGGVLPISGRLTSGHYSLFDTAAVLTQRISDGKCIHGQPTFRGEAGIHKDNDSRLNHAEAKSLATRATTTYIRQVVQLLQDSGREDAACELLGGSDCPLAPPSSPISIQPANDTGGKDIWTTSVFSFADAGGGPGGGLNNDTLEVGGWGDEYRSLIQFDLSDPTLPKQPTSAVLRLYDYFVGVNTQPMTLFRITQAWDWRTEVRGSDKLRLWWAYQPTAVQVLAAGPRPTVLPAPVKNAFYDIDITDLYKSWQADPTQNFGLELRPTITVNSWNFFYSSNYSVDTTKRPQLIVTP